jgi:transposase
MKLNEQQLKQLVELYQSGATIKSIVTKFAVSDRTIHKYLRDNGVTLRRAGNPKQVHLPPVSVLEEMINEGMSIKAIAKEFKVADDTVRRRLGIDRRETYRSRIFSDDDVKEIVKLHRQGISNRTIANRWGVSPSTIGYCLRRVK